MKYALIASLGVAFTWASSTGATNVLTLTTEDYAPFTFMEGETVVGIGGDQVHEIMARAGVSYEIQMFPWARAFRLAASQADTCVFTTARTPEREERFRWVGPLYVSRAVVAVDADSGITVESPDDLASLRIGTQIDDFTIELLSELGVTDIDLASTIDTSIEKLHAGRLDAVSTTAENFAAIAEAGENLVEVFTLQEIHLSIACNPSVSEETIDRMQNALDEIRESGLQSEIIARY